jgi:AcrR family transcriptional regulator
MSTKKEALAQFHRDNIIAAAKELFDAKGVEATSMDEIAAKAQYSKSTVYVYFSGKEDIYYSIVSQHINRLYEGIADILNQQKVYKNRYFSICNLLAAFYEQYPMYSDYIFAKVSVNPADFERLPVLKTIFETSEKINELMAAMLKEDSEGGGDKNARTAPAGLVFWSSISSIITYSAGKDQYLQEQMGMSREDFLKFGFNLLFQGLKRWSAT